MESDGARSAAGAADEDAVVADVVSPYKGSAVPRASVLTKVGELSAASSALAHAPRESAQALRAAAGPQARRIGNVMKTSLG